MLGNLREVVLPTGTVVEYLIDGLNRRVGKLVDGSLVQGFLYGGAPGPIAELGPDGTTLVARFVYATRGHVPDYMVKGGNTYRLITDQLGSVRLVVDTTTGSVVQQIDYDAWGVVVSDTNPGFQPFGFAGGLWDADTGLVRFGARDYDADVGRWTAKDPIGFGGRTANLYLYVGGNPVNLRDVRGTEVCGYTSADGYGHQWVEIGGDPNRTYGYWPVASPFGGPGKVAHPDDSALAGEGDNPDTAVMCVAATSGEEDELEQWIRNNFEVNVPLQSHNYWFGINDCRHFENSVFDALDKIQNRRSIWDRLPALLRPWWRFWL